MEVSIHAPAWGATPSVTAPTWRRTRFQSTHPRGVRPGIREIINNQNKFQSTHPRGVRPGGPRPKSCGRKWFQSTHPRGVRPARPRAEPRPAQVSIHAPAWGATCASCRLLSAHAQFQSTHPRGVRPALPSRLAPGPRFQSTHPRGVRLLSARDATREPTGFNPRTRVGCDMPSTDAPPCRLMFQSTHPRGVRQVPVWPLLAHQWQFQSTHPRGVRRSRNTRRGLARYVSIHAPAWGATWHANYQYGPCKVSIHAPAWGATWMLCSTSSGPW